MPPMNHLGTIRPKKSLGQNFLKDPHFLDKIVAAAGVGPQDRVLEIGPGLGHLTRVLAERAQQVLALELDDRLIPCLRSTFDGVHSVDIVQCDALAYPFENLPGTWKVVANLPYYISTPIIQRLLNCRDKFSTITLLLQKEVAARIASPPGGKEYGYLSVLVQLYAEPKIEFLVPAGAFTPIPEVDSSVITLMVRDHPAISKTNTGFLMRLVKAAFSQRRKTLKNSLKQLRIPAGSMDLVGSATGIDLGRRAETLSIGEFCVLAEFLHSKLVEK